MDKGIALLNGNRVIHFNDTFARLFQRPATELADAALTDLLDFNPPDWPSGNLSIADVIALAEQEGVAWFEACAPKHGGQLTWLDVNLIARPRDHESELLVLVGDITPWKALEQDHAHLTDALHARGQLLSLASEYAGTSFWEFDYRAAEFRWLRTQEKTSPITMGTDALERIKDHLVRQCQAASPSDKRDSAVGISFETEVPDSMGSSRWFSIKGKITGQESADSGPKFLGVAIDVQEQRTAGLFIDRLLHLDGATNLPNRKSFLESLRREIHLAEIERTSGAVLILYTDRIRSIHRIFGYKVANRVLVDFVSRLRSVVRGSDTLYRIGDDEFAILLTGLHRDLQISYRDASGVAVRMLRDVSDHYGDDDHRFWLQGSIGLACFPWDGNEPLTLVQHAQSAAHHAQDAGGIRVAPYRQKLVEQERKTLEIDQSLREALLSGQFELHYQPQLVDGTVISGAEALLRWRHPTLGLVSAGEFIEIAERSGAILEIGRWVIDAAFRQLAEWRAEGLLEREFELSINISAIQLCHPTLWSTLQTAILSHKVDPSRITLEITESAMLLCDGGADDVIRRIVDMGMKISIDDFGIGYSSLRHLKRLPVHQIKIDREFVGAVSDRPEHQAIIKAILSIADAFRLQVVAEGVESELDSGWLIGAGCGRHQGFHCGRPVPAPLFRDLYLLPSGDATK